MRTPAQALCLSQVASDLLCEASAAQAAIIREAATTANPSLAARAAALQEARDAAHRARPPRADSQGGAARARMTSPEAQENSQNPNRSTNAHQVRELLSSVATSMAVVSQSEISSIVQSINVSNPAVSQAASAPALRSKRERLAELAALLADGIISEMEHSEGRAKIIAE
jgi:hypothetical protein